MAKNAKNTKFKKWLSSSKSGRQFFKRYHIEKTDGGQFYLVSVVQGAKICGPGWVKSGRTRQKAGWDEDDRNTDTSSGDTYVINRGIHVYVFPQNVDKKNYAEAYTSDSMAIRFGKTTRIGNVLVPVQALREDYVANEWISEASIASMRLPDNYKNYTGEAVFMKVRIAKKDWDDAISFAKKKIAECKRKKK